MLTREALWRRLSGEGLWPLAWALAAACALPWLVPESWDGRLAPGLQAAGWALVLATGALLRHRHWSFLPLALALAWGALGGLGRQARLDATLPTGWTRVEGTISAPWSSQGGRLRSALALTSPPVLFGQELPLLVASDQEPPPAPGTPVRVQGELVPVDPGPRFLAERPLWRARQTGATRRVQVPSGSSLEATGPPRPGPALRLQTFARARFEALGLPEGPARDVWGALTLGLPPAQDEVTSRFAESGTLHTLVVSGLQITLLLVLLEALLRRALGRAGSFAALALSLAYAVVVGWSAPVWRGWLMGAAWALGRTSGWRLPPVATLHGALLLWFLGHPGAGADPGFLLAWWALLGLLWGTESVEGLLAPLAGRAARPLAAALTPWAATLPLLALFHGGGPTWGVLANLAVVPLLTLFTPVCLGLMLLPLPGSSAVAAALTWLFDHLLPPFVGVRPLATAPWWPWMLLLAGWLWLGQRRSRFQRCRALATALCAMTLVLVASRGLGTPPTALTLEAIDIGQGDALLMRAPGADALLVDTGPSPWSARRIARVLGRRGVREPLRLVVTHPHADHAGGWATLQRLWPPAQVGLPEAADPDELWSPWRPAQGPRPEPLRRGEAWPFGRGQVSVRWPPKAFRLPDPNMVSAVLRLRWQDRELWLMGDALDLQERDLLDLGDPEPGPFHRLLKVGHHGSRSSSDPAWLQALGPDGAIVPAGRRNRFGHPHAETLEGLRQTGLPAPWLVGERLGVRLTAVPGGWSWEDGRGARGFTPFRTPRPAPALR